MRTKLKTHRGAAKRFKITGTGKIMRKQAGKRHLLTHKEAKRKRGLGGDVPVHPGEVSAIARLLPYGN
ncbi:MAG: 50S ribosomal protein L35 [Candidatus Manganitrophus sp.]|nr:50S ribosomal protein L35 [Candidatus Manganitrophus morganii]MDC4206824.1 50S ribosomal protein L35 [Candidatus Manganitrophus sp.]MCG3116657.1 50S ribosomal protein L35 [Candidatus Manganitrophus morganii]MDC4223122.1 50S ribosomal protein L35 [Candidatus Manganitrophus sp.]MDC4225092.1 50S ribosomal protein L35 [Candidatus Manganitrophus sp.]